MTDAADRGVSEVLGFVLIFGMVLTAVVVVSATGQGGLRAARDHQRLDNAERSFDVLAENVEELVWYGAPSRSTELKLAGAQVSLGDPVTVNVTTHPVGDPGSTRTYEYETRPIVYDAGTGTRLVYSDGAVLREERSGSLVRRAPALAFDGERSTLPILQLRAAGARSIGGDANAQVQARRVTTDVLVVASEPTVVTYAVESPRAAAWRRHLRAAHPDATCTGDDERVACTVTTDHVVVTVVRVDVTLR